RRLRRGYRPIAVLLGRINAGPGLRRRGASRRAGTRLPRRAALEPGGRPSTSTLLIGEASLDSRARTMDWKYKALLQWGFSHLPGGERMNYFFQRRVTKNLPVDQITFVSRVVAARQHLEALRRYANRPPETLTFYEFGAGWDLIVPLTLYSLGVNRQILVDVRSLIRPDLIENTIERLAAVSIEPPLIRRPRSLNG